MTVFTDSVQFKSAVLFQGSVRFDGTTVIGANSVNNAAIESFADISADKLQHRHSKTVQQADGTDVVNKTEYIFLARAAGTIKSIKVRPITAPTGGDKAFTVDLQRAADGSGSFATLLSSVITVDNSSVDHTIQDGILIGSPSFAANEVLRIVVTVSGSTGSQGQGVIIEVEFDESGV